MYFFHIEYELNSIKSVSVLKSENIIRAFTKWLFDYFYNNQDVANFFFIINNIQHEIYDKRIEDHYNLFITENFNVSCKRSNVIDQNHLCYHHEDAIEFVYQVLPEKTKGNISKGDVEYILSAFTNYLAEQGLVSPDETETDIADLMDNDEIDFDSSCEVEMEEDDFSEINEMESEEEANPIIEFKEVCAFVQAKALSENIFYEFDDISEVYEANFQYEVEAGIADVFDEQEIHSLKDSIDISSISLN